MDTLEIDDNLYINRDLINQVSFHRINPPSRSCLIISLGFVCVFLLAGNVAQIIFFEIISRPDATQASYNSLTQEKEQNVQNDSDALMKYLQISLTNLSQDNELLQQNIDSLTSERDEFNVSLSNVKNERDQLQESYNSLKRDRDQLEMRYSDTQRKMEQLQIKHDGVTASKEQLERTKSELQRERDGLKTLYSALEAKEIQLERNYSVLQRSYDSLSLSENNLQSSYSSLWKVKEQLQTRFNSLSREKQQLHTNYSSLVKARDQIQNRADKMADKIRAMNCQTSWTKFELSCYFVSTVKKNWTESREACTAEGADLLIIDSTEEQMFINGLLSGGQNAWIGLTDSDTEGQWTWVDGTPVTTTFWQPGQPNNYYKDQDCGEYLHEASGSIGQWNDDGCFASQTWICEK